MNPPVHDASARQHSGEPSSVLGSNDGRKDRLQNPDRAELEFCEIAGLVDRSTQELRRAWRTLYHSGPPLGLSRDLIIRGLADKLQQCAHGGPSRALQRRFLAVHIVVALETAVAAQETLVLETPHRLPDSEFAHYLTRSPWWQGNPCSSELLQSRDTRTGAILVLLSGAAVDAAGVLEDAVTNDRHHALPRGVRWSARSAIPPLAQPNAAETTAFPGWHDRLFDLSALPLSRGTEGSNPASSVGESVLTSVQPGLRACYVAFGSR